MSKQTKKRLKAAVIFFIFYTMLLSCSMPTTQVVGSNAVKANKNLIIYPEVFQDTAERFKSFHQDYESVESLLITVEEIDKTETPSEKPEYTGWANTKPQLVQFKEEYKFDLARKIISYIRKKVAKNEISSILILGDASFVPPSYYAYIRDFLKGVSSEYDEYNRWIPSDFLYASPDFDLKYDIPVGRLPIRTNMQGVQFITKMLRWKSMDQKINETDKVIYMGGNVSNDYRMLGEMLFLKMHDEKLLGNNVSFLLESQDKFKKQELLDVFEKENASILWVFAHGDGAGFGLSDGILSSTDISAAEYKKGLPLILSPSCKDGGFDGKMLPKLGTKDTSDNSIAEGIVKSSGCGIGYLGSIRSALTNIKFTIENGKVRVNETVYMTNLLMKFLNAYYNKKICRIGDALKEAYRDFGASVKSRDAYVGATYVNFVFLGDPVLTMSKPPEFRESSFDGVEFIDPHTFNSKNNMIMFPSNTKTIRFKPTQKNNDTEINFTIYNISENKSVIPDKTLKPDTEYTFHPDGNDLFLLISYDKSAKMVWQYFVVGEDIDIQGSAINITTTGPDSIFSPEPVVEPTPVSTTPENYEMVYVPAGEFTRGSDQTAPDEKPVKNIYLDAYSIGKYEVPNKLYKEYIKSGGSVPDYWGDENFNNPNQPVVGVTWEDAVQFTNWMSEKAGLEACYSYNDYKKEWVCDFTKKGYRLPTEAEWEKAGRGTDGRLYPWGGNEFKIKLGEGTKANVADKNLPWGEPEIDDGYKFPAPVGSYPKGVSPYGCYDMAGNVWEWTNDWYDRLYYESSPDKNPTGPDRGFYKVKKGGSWDQIAMDIHCSYRSTGTDKYSNSGIGFRVALPEKKQ